MINRSKVLLVLGAGLLGLIVLGTLLQMIRTLLWDLSYLLPGWLITPVLLLTVALIAALIVQFGWPWWQAWQRRRSKPSEQPARDLEIPKDRRQAANRSLGSLDQLLERLENDVQRAGLQQERERVEQELNRGDLVVVVFGTGSSGKTSLIRALLQEMVGTTSAAMGSTRQSSRYRMRLHGLTRSLQLVDTPGILESGPDGRSREESARHRAVRADLLLVVVDGDLRASELEVIRSIADLGKRVLLILNKRDLRGVDEERRLLDILRSRCKGMLQPSDILACSAAPQSIPRPGGRPLQPDADVNELLQRLASVLHAEGEELIADNILLQCRHLDARGRDLLTRQRRQEAQRCVDRYSWIGAGVVAANPLPGVDLLGTAAVNAQMVMELARVYGIELAKEQARELAVSVGRTLAGLGVIKSAVTVIGTALSLSLPTMLAGRAIQAVAAAWLTRVAGASFIRYFEHDQDWGDGGMQDVLQEQFDLNRRDASLKRFLAMAMRQVVEPLQQMKAQRLPPRPEPPAAGGASGRGRREP
ncbi:YcjF family protein [Synechococcus sp. MIT S1220]|uniref:YcjF family protein n=1 Tax=Synechococcus sp. MIT S1220 TaxID=3082549 RepID=UPI0039AFFAAD